MSGNKHGEGDDVSREPTESRNAVYKEALTETRDYLNKQFEIAENTDEEILTLLRSHLLVLGGVVTLIAYLPELIVEALPWIVLSGFFIASSILLSTYIYRGIGIYSGFGDHGFDKYAPDEKLLYNSIIQDLEKQPNHGRSCSEENISSVEKFRERLLTEHQAGITHNNFELKYRNKIQQEITILLLSGIVILGVGITTTLSENSDILTIVFVLIITVFITLVGISKLIGSLKLLHQYRQTSSDPNRMSYDYAFDWD